MSVPNPSSGTDAIALYSTDGNNWSPLYMAASAVWKSLVFTGTKFVTIPSSGYTNANTIVADYVVPSNSDFTEVQPVAAQSSSAITFPTTYPRIDRLGVDVMSGALTYIQGIEAASPVAPAYEDGTVPVCSINLAPGQGVITNAHITDERWFINTGSPSDSTGGSAVAYQDQVAYELFDVAGSYNFPRPPGASMYRITMFGAGGGGGGKYTDASYTNEYLGGCGGGGSCATLTVFADDLTIVVGAGGAGGAHSTAGTNNATAGSAGTASTVTFASSGTILTVNPGSGGARGVSTPAVGAGGAGGAATLGGFAGGAGLAGVVQADSYGTYPEGGSTGEQSMFKSVYLGAVMGIGGDSGGVYTSPKGSDGVVMIEWW